MSHDSFMFQRFSRESRASARQPWKIPVTVTVCELLDEPAQEGNTESFPGNQLRQSPKKKWIPRSHLLQYPAREVIISISRIDKKKPSKKKRPTCAHKKQKANKRKRKQTQSKAQSPSPSPSQPTNKQTNKQTKRHKHSTMAPIASTFALGAGC